MQFKENEDYTCKGDSPYMQRNKQSLLNQSV